MFFVTIFAVGDIVKPHVIGCTTMQESLRVPIKNTQNRQKHPVLAHGSLGILCRGARKHFAVSAGKVQGFYCKLQENVSKGGFQCGQKGYGIISLTV